MLVFWGVSISAFALARPSSSQRSWRGHKSWEHCLGSPTWSGHGGRGSEAPILGVKDWPWPWKWGLVKSFVFFLKKKGDLNLLRKNVAEKMMRLCFVPFWGEELHQNWRKRIGEWQFCCLGLEQKKKIGRSILVLPNHSDMAIVLAFCTWDAPKP